MLVLLLAAAPIAWAAPGVAGSRAAPSNAAARKGAAAPLPPFITLTNKAGMSVTLTAVGASIQALRVPARDGKGPATDVILGYKTAEAYRTPPLPSFGATVGRVANRISNASYTLDGRTVQLESNDGSNFIHGGAFRYSQQVWAAQRQDSAAGQAVTFRLTDRENIPNGFPGTVLARVRYFLPAASNRLEVTMTGTTNKATPINVINHSYFNLAGEGNRNVLDQVLQLQSEYYTPASPSLLPTGAIKPVAGTPYDFTTPARIGKRLSALGNDPAGYDTNYVLYAPAYAVKEGANRATNWWRAGVNPQTVPANRAQPPRLAATVTEPVSGRRMSVFTDAPGVQLYTANFLDGTAAQQSARGKYGGYYPQYGGFCLEAGAFPNAINTPGFPSEVLNPGQQFTNRVTFAFSYV